MRDTRHEYKEFSEKREERHKKRVERQRLLHDGDSDDHHGSGSRLTHHSAPDLYQGGRYDQQPYYVDDNPYASGGLPAPPVGYSAYESRR